MRAGRELDALIMEKVFGYGGAVEVTPGQAYKQASEDSWCNVFTVHPSGRRVMGSYDRFTDRNGKRVSYQEYDGGVFVPKNYSTDIKDAWVVVEEMKDRPGEIGSRFGFSIGEAYGGEHGYQVSIGKYCATADTAPLAICLAALKSVGCEVPV